MLLVVAAIVLSLIPVDVVGFEVLLVFCVPLKLSVLALAVELLVILVLALLVAFVRMAPLLRLLLEAQAVAPARVDRFAPARIDEVIELFTEEVSGRRGDWDVPTKRSFLRLGDRPLFDCHHSCSLRLKYGVVGTLVCGALFSAVI